MVSGTATAPPVLLSVAGLRVQYSGMVALDGVSLDVREGEIFGLIGPNGAGKTTLIEAVSGFLPDAEGEVTFNGTLLRGLRPDQRVARGLGRTFQSLELFEDLTVRENLYVAYARPTWWHSVLDLVRWSRWPAAARQAVDDALELLGITQFGDDLPSQLPNGVRKLVAVARAVAGNARLLLLDEPAAGLETTESLDLGERLRALASAGTSLLLVDHDMGLVLSVCDRVHVLDFGKTIAEGTPEEIRASAAVVAAYLGTDAESGSS
ncbi:MAG TPA: ABC transporter ATP-binding protein [Trebonia sp.]|nr:ABC transporter ATP-binding protein [Trebonia sp.]